MAGIRSLRTTGRVEPDENRIYPIVAAVSGWIRNAESVTTGDAVKKDQVLASFLAPEVEFRSAQQSYFTGLEAFYRLAITQPQSHASVRGEVIDRMADALRSMGVSNSQLREMGKRRELVQDIRVESPVDGVVLKRSVSPGLRFDRGFEFYRIADLNRVWILAEVYRHQLPFIRRGASARIVTAEQRRALSATVSQSEGKPGWSSLTTNSTPRSPRLRSCTRNSRQLLSLSRFASSTANTQRRPSSLMPIATSTARLRITPSSRTFS